MSNHAHFFECLLVNFKVMLGAAMLYVRQAKLPSSKKHAAFNAAKQLRHFQVCESLSRFLYSACCLLPIPIVCRNEAAVRKRWMQILFLGRISEIEIRSHLFPAKDTRKKWIRKRAARRSRGVKYFVWYLEMVHLARGEL